MQSWFRLALTSFVATMALSLVGVAHKRASALTRGSTTTAQAVPASVRLDLAQVADGQARRVAPRAVPRAVPRAIDATLDRARIDDTLVADSEGWAPPSWFPDESRVPMWSVEAMDAGHGTVGPDLDLHSQGFFVYDIDSGEVILAHGEDERRPVASLTKVVSALALVSDSPDLDTEICTDSSMRPSWPGAVSRIRTGTCSTGWDLLGAALVRSDNGAAYTFATIAGMSHYPFVERMNQVASDLRMSMSSFSDPSGAEDDNLSTARDMTRAVLAASLHPMLAPVTSAPYWDFSDLGRGRVRRLFTTDKLVGDPGVDILAAKTGYTDTARYCFTAVAQTRSGRKVAFTTLGAWKSRYRWADVRAILSWVERGGGR